MARINECGGERTIRRAWRVVLVAVALVAAALLGYGIRRASAERTKAPSPPLWFAGTLMEGPAPAEGDRNVTIALFAAETGGTALCTKTDRGVRLTAGRFRVSLQDPECAAAVAANDDLWIEATVTGPSGTTTFPRMKLGAVPYALVAAQASEASRLAIDARREMTGVGEVWNCRLAYDSASGTLSVVGRDLAPLSPENPCFVGIADGGVASFEAPVSVVLADDPNTFGSTAGRAWNYDRPFFVAACDGTTQDFFGISLNPIRASTGSDVAGMCQPRAVGRCNAQNSLLVMDADLSLAGEVNRPCVVVGSFRAQKSTADRWSVTALTASDGFGRSQEGVQFTMPTGQNGAQPGEYLGTTGAGTVPSCPTRSHSYWLFRTGFVVINFAYGSTSSTECSGGTGDRQTWLALPYVAASGAPESIAGYAVDASGFSASNTGNLYIVSGSTAAVLERAGDWRSPSEWGPSMQFWASGVTLHAFSP